MHLIGDSDNESDGIMAATIQNNAFLGSRLAANTLDEDVSSEIAESLAGYEIVFSYNTYRFTYIFADFLDYICEDYLVANFDTSKIYDALEYINNQIASSSNIDKEAAIYDAMAVLSGSQDDNIVILTREWIRNENLLGKDLLGTFYTYFNSGEAGRNGNIRRAADLIDNLTLLPGQSFSMNESIGPVALDNGYYTALVIANGEFVEGIGGGVCQVASTLYMAVLYAELEVLQRRAHSRMVGYVPPAFDAVLATPYLDLRFGNDTTAPITIETKFDYRNNRLTVNIWGQETRQPTRTISFESVQAAANDTYVSYHLYKIENNNGVFARSRINISTYRAEQEGAMTYYEAINED